MSPLQARPDPPENYAAIHQIENCSLESPSLRHGQRFMKVIMPLPPCQPPDEHRKTDTARRTARGGYGGPAVQAACCAPCAGISASILGSCKVSSFAYADGGPCRPPGPV